MHRPKEKTGHCPVCGVKIVLESAVLIPFHTRWNDKLKDYERCPGIGRAV